MNKHTMTELEKDIEQYFEDFGVSLTPQFSLENMAVDCCMNTSTLATFLCNLEDVQVMEDIANGVYTSFDSTDSTQFNDSYKDILEDIISGDEDTVTFRLPKFEECTASLHVEDMPNGPGPDDFSDEDVIDEIYEQMESNDWAWCLVEHRVSWKGITASEYLGNCSYASEKDYRENSGYYEDMMKTAYERLITQLKALAE